MGYLPAFIHPDRADAPEVRRYRDLLAQSASARDQGNHWMAQQLASAAHRWAMDEMIRLNHLARAEAALAQAQERLDQAWDQDRSCTTLEELSEQYPQYRRVIAAWETAKQRMQEFVAPTPLTEDLSVSSRRPRR